MKIVIEITRTALGKTRNRKDCANHHNPQTLCKFHSLIKIGYINTLQILL